MGFATAPEAEVMGKILVAAIIANDVDLSLADRGMINADQIRRVEVAEALVEMEATTLSLPARMIQDLGLMPLPDRRFRTEVGIVKVRVFGAARLTIEGRDCAVDVIELPEEGAILIGRIPLLLLDLVVDRAGQRVMGNPDHGGEHIMELY